MPEPSKEELLARIAELEKQVDSKKQGSLEFKVSEKRLVVQFERLSPTLTCFPAFRTLQFMAP